MFYYIIILFFVFIVSSLHQSFLQHNAVTMHCIVQIPSLDRSSEDNFCIYCQKTLIYSITVEGYNLSPHQSHNTLYNNS